MYTVLVVGWEVLSYTAFEGDEDMEICMVVQSENTVLQTQARVSVFDTNGGSNGAEGCFTNSIPVCVLMPF